MFCPSKNFTKLCDDRVKLRFIIYRRELLIRNYLNAILTGTDDYSRNNFVITCQCQ